MANSTTAVSILPTNSTPWEIAVDLTSAERHPWPVDVIRDVWDPWKCPEHLLPYLAASLSVDLWNPTWPVETKRLVIDKAIWLHRHKGTLAGIREHLALVGVAINDVIVPPHRCVVIQARTASERRAALAGLPELRVHVYRPRRDGKGREAQTLRCPTAGAVIVSGADDRTARRAELVRNGVSETIKWGIVPGTAGEGSGVPVERIIIPAKGDARRATADRAVVGGAVILSGTRSRIFTIGVDRSSTGNEPRVMPARHEGLDVVNVTPERVFGRGTGSSGIASVGNPVGGVLTRSRMPIYDSWRLVDRTRTGTRRSGLISTVVGVSRISWPAFTAELHLSQPIKRRGRPFFVGSPIGSTIAIARDPWRDPSVALEASRAYRDKITFTTATRRPRTLADGYSLDSGFAFGETVAISRI